MWHENVSDDVNATRGGEGGGGGEGGKEERQPTSISAVAPLVKEAFPLVSACSCSLPLLAVYSTQKTVAQRHTPRCSQYQTPEAIMWSQMSVLFVSVNPLKLSACGQKGGFGFSGTSCWPSSLGYLYAGSGGSHDTLRSHRWLRNVAWVAEDVTIRAEKGRRVFVSLNHQRKQMLSSLMPWLYLLCDIMTKLSYLPLYHPLTLITICFSSIRACLKWKKAQVQVMAPACPSTVFLLNEIWTNCTLNYNKC